MSAADGGTLREARDAVRRIYEYGKEACAGDLHRLRQFTERVQNDPYLQPASDREQERSHA